MSNPTELPPLDPAVEAYLERLRKDPRYFCESELKIMDKDNNLVPWRWNSAQVLLFAAVWAMWITMGYVRLFGVKGRQQGFSTLVAGLYFWLAVVHGKKIIIIAHKQDSTEILFGKMQVFYDNLSPLLKPKADTSNAKQYKFDNGGSVTCVTAGSGEAGRGDTAQAQHRSEVAFFENPAAIKAGVGRTVSKLKGTFIIQESTGNGENDFYSDVMKAVKGEGIYQYVFVPWFIQEEYRADVPEDFQRTDEEDELVKLYGLDDQQLMWRRLTIDELAAKGYPGEVKFKQEYPCTLQEAFQSSTESFIDPLLVARARASNTNPDGHEPRILGVDPGRVRDRTVLIKRQGRRMYEPEIHPFMESMQLAGIIARKFDNDEIDYAFIDVGMGWGTIDRLRELGYGRKVFAVDFGSGPFQTRFLNKRAEMFFAFNDWLKEGNTNIPDDDEVSSDISAIPMFKESSTGKISFPSKDEIRKTLKRSTDIFDAMVLTFAFPVKSQEAAQERQKRDFTKTYETDRYGNVKRQSSLSARRHVESMRTGEDSPGRWGRRM